MYLIYISVHFHSLQILLKHQHSIDLVILSAMYLEGLECNSLIYITHNRISFGSPSLITIIIRQQFYCRTIFYFIKLNCIYTYITIIYSYYDFIGYRIHNTYNFILKLSRVYFAWFGIICDIDFNFSSFSNTNLNIFIKKPHFKELNSSDVPRKGNSLIAINI